MDSPHHVRASHGLQDYFQKNEDQHEETVARLSAMERTLQERDAMVDEMAGGLEAAWDKIELLEGQLERYAQGDALQAKMESIAQSYQQQVDMMGRELEEVRESLSDETAVRHAINKAMDERTVADRLQSDLAAKQRRSLFLFQTFSRIRTGLSGAVKRNVLVCWWEVCMAKHRRRHLLVKTVSQIMMLKGSQAFSHWAGVARAAVKQKQASLLDAVEAAHKEIFARFDDELGSSSTLARLAEVEKTMADEANQTRSLVQEFFEYQQKFEVDLVADRAQDAAEQRARLTAVKADVMEEVERLETRVREELVGCVVRCDGISREFDSAKAQRAEAEDEVYATRAKAEAVIKQLAGMQKLHAQHVESERLAVRKLEDKIRELQTRSGQGQKEMHACRAELRALAAAGAKARGEAALVRQVDYDEVLPTQPPSSMAQPAIANEHRVVSESADSAVAPVAATASAPQRPAQQDSASAVSSSRTASNRYTRGGGSPARGNTRGHSPGRYTRTQRSAAAEVGVDANAQVEEGVPQAHDSREMAATSGAVGDEPELLVATTPQLAAHWGAQSTASTGGGSLKGRAPVLPSRSAVYRPNVAARRNSRDRTVMPD
eukprot:COSAG03_NODE_165_length_11302_cov_262.544943_7_plen_606_part_00